MKATNYIKSYSCWRKRRKTDIFNLGGSVYTFFDYDRPLPVGLLVAKFRRKKGGIKVHTLYDIETQIPAFLHITTASVHDVKAMPEIPLEAGAYYIFDRGYNDFANLAKINAIGARFVVRVKSNLRYERVSWKMRLAKGVKSDSEIRFSVYKSARDYPGELRRVAYYDEETDKEYVFLTNDLDSSALVIADLYRNRRQVELFFKWLKQHLRIKKLWGTTENAVRIQIYCAIITYCRVG